MTVGELIVQLQQFDLNKIVYTEYGLCGDLTTIEKLLPISSEARSKYDNHIYMVLKEIESE